MALQFLNSDSSRVATPKRLNNKMIESIILLFKRHKKIKRFFVAVIGRFEIVTGYPGTI